MIVSHTATRNGLGGGVLSNKIDLTLNWCGRSTKRSTHCAEHTNIERERERLKCASRLERERSIGHVEAHRSDPTARVLAAANLCQT